MKEYSTEKYERVVEKEKVDLNDHIMEDSEEWSENDRQYKKPVIKKRSQLNRDYYSSKKKSSGCLKTLLLWLFFMIVGISLIATYFAFTHKFFSISKILVEGNSKISYEEIVAGLPFKKGDNIFKADLKKAKENLLKIHGMDQVEIERIIPNKIRIRISEGFDMGFMNINGEIFIVDKDGNIKQGTMAETKDLIEFKSVNSKNIKPGININQDKNFGLLMNALKTKNYYKDIAYLDLGDLNNFVMGFKDGLKVTFNNQDIERELNILSKLLTTISTEGIEAKEIIMNVGKDPVIIKNDEY